MGRKGRIALPIYGLKDPILFDRERMDEFELYRAGGANTDPLGQMSRRRRRMMVAATVMTARAYQVSA